MNSAKQCVNNEPMWGYCSRAEKKKKKKKKKGRKRRREETRNPNGTDINFALVVVHGTVLYVTLILHYFGWYKCVRALHLVAVHSIRLFVTSILHYFLVLIVGRFEFMIYMIYCESLLFWIIINSNGKIIEFFIVK